MDPGFEPQCSDSRIVLWSISFSLLFLLLLQRLVWLQNLRTFFLKILSWYICGGGQGMNNFGKCLSEHFEQAWLCQHLLFLRFPQILLALPAKSNRTLVTSCHLFYCRSCPTHHPFYLGHYSSFLISLGCTCPHCGLLISAGVIIWKVVMLWKSTLQYPLYSF